MTLKLATGFLLGALLWLVCLSPGMKHTPAAFAEGPSAAADPIAGPLSQTFVLTLWGFQPYTQLTLSFLPPGAGSFVVVDTPQPVVTDGFGQSLVPLNVAALLGADPSLAGLASLLGLVSVVWEPVGGGVAQFRVAACDTLNCAESIGTVIPN